MKTSFYQKRYGSQHWVSGGICKPVLKLNFTALGIKKSLSEFGLDFLKINVRRDFWTIYF
jgi:hypothetical protein